MTAYLGLSSGDGVSLQHLTQPPVYPRDDSKASLNILMRLQSWVTREFSNIHTTFLSDSNSEQFLRISRSTPHPVLVTMPSVQLVCRVDKEMLLNCQLLAYNSIVIKEIVASLDEEYEDLKILLNKLNNHQTSICKGIPEEKLVTWAIRKNLSQILIERFQTRVVFRERNCSYVMFESDQADICRSCAMLLSSSSMDLHGDQELECPHPECARTFKYQGALDKHIQKHKEEGETDEPSSEEKPCQVKEEVRTNEPEGSLNQIKMEPEVNIKETKTEQEQVTCEDGQFIDRLLDDIDQDSYPTYPKKKKRLKKPSNKDFACSDCGKAFFYQKNLFTHVVEAHGKSVDELPNLTLVKSEDGRKRKKRRKGKGGKSEAYCNECGVTFKFASGLYNHRKRMHGDTEKVQCGQCDRMVKMCTLDQHIREEHGTPRYACQFCGKGFYYKSFMLNHQRLHTGDYKECICDLCGAVYKSVQVLNRHVRNAHQDLRNFKCSHCDKAFHNKQRLDRHVNSQHTKSKLWPCPACHSKYDRKDNLRTHIRKNHAGVLNPDTVPLVPIDNDGGIEMNNKVKGRHGPPNQLIPQTFLMTVERNSTTTPTTSERTSTSFPPAPLSDRSQSVDDPIVSVQPTRDFVVDAEFARSTQDIIKREDPLLIPSRHETDLLRLAAVQQQHRSSQQQNQHQQQRTAADFIREKQQDRFGATSPPGNNSQHQQMRDAVSAAVRDFTVPVREVMQAVVRDAAHTSPVHAHSGVTHTAHSLAQTLHPSSAATSQNPYTFHGLQGHPQI